MLGICSTFTLTQVTQPVACLSAVPYSTTPCKYMSSFIQLLKKRDMFFSEHNSPVSMNDRAERQSVPPALGEVLDLDVGVAVGRLLRPPQEGLLRRHILLSDNDI